MSIIGKQYIPDRNDYCINIETKRTAYVAFGFHSDEETNAKFTIVCEPYKKRVKCFFSRETVTFINIKSSNTNNVYRVRFLEKLVVKNKKYAKQIKEEVEEDALFNESVTPLIHMQLKEILNTKC